MNKIGFVIPGQKVEKSKKRAAPRVQEPQSLLDLRRKIAQMTVYMCSSSFSRMRRGQRLLMLEEYNQAVVLEMEFGAAVAGAGGVREFAAELHEVAD
jgi:hypothetical protein